MVFDLLLKRADLFNARLLRNKEQPSALAKTRDIITGLFRPHTLKRAITSFDDVMFKTTEIVRPTGASHETKQKDLIHRITNVYSLT